MLGYFIDSNWFGSVDPVAFNRVETWSGLHPVRPPGGDVGKLKLCESW